MKLDKVLNLEYGEGICTSCEETQMFVEPDAENYECESCGEHTVQGKDNLIMELV